MLQLQRLAHFGRDVLGELRARHIQYQVVIIRAVRLIERNGDGLGFADGHARHPVFKPGDDLMIANHKLDRIAASR